MTAGIVMLGHLAILPYPLVSAGVDRVVADVVVKVHWTSIYADMLQVAGSIVGSFPIGII